MARKELKLKGKEHKPKEKKSVGVKLMEGRSRKPLPKEEYSENEGYKMPGFKMVEVSPKVEEGESNSDVENEEELDEDIDEEMVENKIINKKTHSFYDKNVDEEYKEKRMEKAMAKPIGEMKKMQKMKKKLSKVRL